MATPGVATASTLAYSKEVNVALANNEINLADIEDYGHRVQIAMTKANLNAYLKWSRSMGASAPNGHVASDSTAKAAFEAALVAALGGTYTDIDAVSGALSFSSAVFDAAADERLRKEVGGARPKSANDVVLAFVLYKLYGSSAYDTTDTVLNIEDAYNMTTSEDVAAAITNSLEHADNAAAINNMFRDLIAADPMRFFDASGNQIPGLFEINSDVSGSGDWGLVQDDIIEIKTKFTFAAPVTRRGVVGGQYSTSTVDTVEHDDKVATNDFFRIRLQIKLTA
jgi:hypothetical protein